jgi:pimeloyl-ACP methyl ester carboxylesterase
MALQAIGGHRDLSFVEANGCRLAYVEAGAGEAVLLIHGLAGDHSAWTPQIEAWSRSFPCDRARQPRRRAFDPDRRTRLD